MRLQDAAGTTTRAQNHQRHTAQFTDEDEARLKAFTSQIAIALENAKLFEDVQNMKNYNESMLESMTNAVVTLDEDGKIVTCNAAGLRILRIKAADIIDKKAEDVFVEDNAWLMEQAAEVDESGEGDIKMDAEIVVGDGEVEKREKINCNVTCLPLLSPEDKKLGVMFMIEDISSEKRMKSTMSRYMDPGLADQLKGLPTPDERLARLLEVQVCDCLLHSLIACQ